MRTLESLSCLRKSRWLLVASLVLLPQLLFAQWTASVGAESGDQGRQALAFLPNEIWIHVGDSITWKLVTKIEPHTVTFLIANQIRNPFNVGCPGYTPDNSPFDGTACVSTPPMVNGQTFTVIFPATGNFKLSCLFHENMQGTVHVLDLAEKLPHDQAFYDNQAKRDSKAMLNDMLQDMGKDGHGQHQPTNAVMVGLGEVVATGGGTRTLSVLRFMQDKVTIHKGDTVEWTSGDVITPHTITFGTEPVDVIDPSANVTVDTDGARHGVINSTSDDEKAHQQIDVATSARNRAPTLPGRRTHLGRQNDTRLRTRSSAQKDSDTVTPRTVIDNSSQTPLQLSSSGQKLQSFGRWLIPLASLDGQSFAAPFLDSH